MNKFKLEVNDIVDISRGDKVYKSKIQVVKEEFIFIDMPLFKSEYLLLKDEEEIKLLVNTKAGNVYELTCITLGKSIIGNIRIYRISNPIKIEKIQRRDYVRVGTTKIIKCLTDTQEFDALLLDLSGGGMRIKTIKKINLNDKIYGVIKDKNNNDIKVSGIVVRVEDTGDKKYNIIGVKFADIKNREREAIIQTVFTIMRKQMELI